MHPTWNLVHIERAALLADLRAISESDWQVQSLCEDWTVHDVVAHLISTARTTGWSFVRGMVHTRFDFDKQNAEGVIADRGATPADTLAQLGAVAERTSGPPRLLAPLASRLVEEVAHGEDIRRPLGLHRSYEPEAVVQAIEYQARTSVHVGGAKELARGVQLVATDLDLRIGSGPAITGPALELLMLVTGRSPHADSLTGPGLGTYLQAK